MSQWVNKMLSWWLSCWINDANALLMSQNIAFLVIVFENRNVHRISIGTNLHTQEVFCKLSACIGCPQLLCLLLYAYSIVIFIVIDVMAIRVRRVSRQLLSVLQNNLLICTWLSLFHVFGLWIFWRVCLKRAKNAQFLVCRRSSDYWILWMPKNHQMCHFPGDSNGNAHTGNALSQRR